MPTYLLYLLLRSIHSFVNCVLLLILFIVTAPHHDLRLKMFIFYLLLFFIFIIFVISNIVVNYTVYLLKRQTGSHPTVLKKTYLI